MSDVSLVPVDHQPDFENVSLVPVDHDPFSANGVTHQAQSQQAQTQPAQSQSGQGAQPQLTQTRPQSQSPPVPTAQPKPTVPGGSAIGGGSGSPFVGFFNQLAAPELAQSQGWQILCGINAQRQRRGSDWTRFAAVSTTSNRGCRGAWSIWSWRGRAYGCYRASIDRKHRGIPHVIKN